MLRTAGRVGRMAEQVKAFAAKPGNPELHVVGGRTVRKVVL